MNKTKVSNRKKLKQTTKMTTVETKNANTEQVACEWTFKLRGLKIHITAEHKQHQANKILILFILFQYFHYKFSM